MRETRGAGHIFQSAVRSGAVIPSDSTILEFKALYVGTTGDVVIKHAEDGDAVTYHGVPSGSRLDVSGVHVMAATTATNVTWMNW